MNVWLVLLSVLYSTTIIFCKVLTVENSITLPNKIGSREDWFILSKYYASIHKPYNVKKYVPYKPSNKTTTVETPLTSTTIHISTTALPEITTQRSRTKGDQIEQTSETGIVETSTFESTTETSTSTTEMPEMSTLLLSIIGKTPGIETSTSYYAAKVESSEQQYLSSTIETSSMIDVAISTTTASPEPETTTELRDSTFQPHNEASYTSEAPATPLDVTTGINFAAVSKSTPPETSTDVGDTTTQLSIFNIETPSSVEDTTNINCLLPTTSFQQEATTESGATTTSSEPDTTTDEADTITQLLVTTTQSPLTTSSPAETTTDTTTQLFINVAQSTQTTSSEPDTTTDEADTTTQSTLTSSSEPEITTETAEATTQIPISTTRTTLLENTTEIPFIPTSTIAFESTTDADAGVEITTDGTMATTSSGNAILVDDIIQAKPRKLTYSSDVMPEMEWY